MTQFDEATLRRRRKWTKVIVGLVLTVLSTLSITVLPRILVERSQEERERNRPAPRSAPAR